MKMSFKRVISLFLIFLYSFSLLPAVVFAEDDIAVLECDFEDELSFDRWLGAIRDENCAYEGDWGIQVLNPFGDESTNLYGHILQYNDYISLEKGRVYTFSAYVSNPSSDDVYTPSASAYIGRNGEELFIDISSVGFNWELVTASFMATENTSAALTITLDGGDMDMGFFMDSISIVPETRIPEYTVLDGQDYVYIPDNGYIDYRYSLVTYDTDDLPINILINELDIEVDNLPESLEFDSASGTLRVHSTAEANQTFTLTCTASIGGNASESSITVTTTRNVLSDADFEDGEENWTSESMIEYADSQINLFADEKGNWGYYTSITYTKQLLLIAGNMYVFRADVGSEPEFASSSVYISNLSFAQSGYAEINITGVGGGWDSVTSAFVIEDTGLYDLTLNLYAPTQRPIYVDNVYLAVENPSPTSISIHSPGHIQIPSDMTILPCYATVRNQLGEGMDEAAAQLTLSPEGSGVYLEGDEIIVTSDAKRGDYTITAAYEDVTATHTVTVSDYMVGDGGFEEKQANEWWTSSDGSVFSIIDYDGDKAGHVYSPDSSCIVINNSYMELQEGEYYVYSAAAGFGEGTVTAFIADAYTGEYIPFAQYDPLEDVKIPFSMSETVIGRLVLYIDSETSVGLLFDDIEIEPAALTASQVETTGEYVGDYIRGSYVYVNNMTDKADADISTTRWYISSTYDGHYEPIGIPNQDYLELTEDMAGQYIVYEVTPVCSYSGLVSDSVRSLPVMVTSASDPPEEEERPLSQMTPVELESVKEHPFTDITAHWSEGMVASLASAGIVSGRSFNKFVPDYYVTRAEFTAMVARAFSLVAMPYSGQFDDISASDWYAGWVEACYRRGIIQGVDTITFAPNERITREQMAAILMRAYLLCDGPLPYDLELRYYDNFLISNWAYASVKCATNLNIFTGDDMNLFRPGDYATRAEAAACLYRTLKCF